MQATRIGLDLHYRMRVVLEGMVASMEPKAGSSDLVEICKKIMPVAGK